MVCKQMETRMPKNTGILGRAQSQQNFSLCHIMQWNYNRSIRVAEEKELVSKQTYTRGTNDKTVNHVEQKSALFGPAMICTNLPHVKSTIPGATECHRNKFQFGHIHYLDD